LLGLAFALGCTPPEAKTPEASGSSKSKNPSSKSDDGDGRDADDGGKPGDTALPDDADMIKEAKGVNITNLTEPQKTKFFQIINTERSACKKPHSLAKSLRDDDKCRDSMVVSQFIADSLAAGATATQIKNAIDKVVDALQPKEIDIEGRAIYGEPNAPITVVVFADFECPHCRNEAPKLRKTVDQFRGRAKLVFKHFPLEFHDRARQAAIAVEAAHDQGKFWEMHDIVFANQGSLSDADLESYAAQIKLDMTKFKASMADKATTARVDKDFKDGDKIGITGTPAVFVNGRMMNEALFGGSLAGWIDDALKR